MQQASHLRAPGEPALNTKSETQTDQPTRPDLSLSIPCYNEVDCLRHTAERLIDAFHAKDVNVELVLVDNGSEDGTGAVIDKMIADGLPVVKQTVTKNIGYGYGVLCGLAASRGKFVGILPADGQTDAKDVAHLYDLLANAKTPKLVKARRRFRMDGFTRKIVSIGYNILANIVFGGLRSIDVNGTPKLFPREYMEKMQLRSTDWFLDTEILLKAKQLNLSVFEVNVFGQMREEGVSHVDGAAIRDFFVNLYRWRFGKFRIKRANTDDRKIPEIERNVVS